MRLTLVVLASLALAGVAGAATTPLEQRLAGVATTVAGRTADVRCYDTAGWAALAASEGWNPDQVFGGVIPGSNLVELSPRVCAGLAAYVGAPPTTACTKTTTKTVTRRVWKRVKVQGKWTGNASPSGSRCRRSPRSGATRPGTP